MKTKEEASLRQRNNSHTDPSGFASEGIVQIHNARSKRYRGANAMRRAVWRVLAGHQKTLERIDVIVVGDPYIARLNRRYLGHRGATDVITFPLDDRRIEGEIYISLDTARRQAKEYGVTLENELCRLAVHGTLHLLGYDDATEAERNRMSELETKYITEQE